MIATSEHQEGHKELIQDFMNIVECGDYQKASKYMQMANYQIDVN